MGRRREAWKDLARAGFAASFCLTGGREAMAQATPSASFPATATIVSGCEIDGALAVGSQSVGQIGILAYGTHSALSTETLSANLVQNAGLAMRCTPGVTLTMTISGGLYADATRAMRASGNTARIGYRLYRDAGFTQEMLADQPATMSFGSADPITLPIFGRLTLPGALPAGVYADTVLVTLNW
jgi:spore coat protein U-like protein